ncbi:hypothetical protein IKW72_01590 [bacterium]|nr:hypothetical protein [bacterium]
MSKRIPTFLLLCACALLSDDQLDNDHILRFNRENLTNSFSVRNNLLNYAGYENPGDWLSFETVDNGGTMIFIAENAEEYLDRRDAMVSVTYEGSNSFGQAVSEGRAFRFLCQWDDCGAIREDEPSPGSIAATPKDFLGSAPDEDTWHFTPARQAYCLEYAASNDLLVVARQSGGQVWSNAVETIGSNAKRLYLTNIALNSQVNFKLSNPSSNQTSTISYRLNLTPVRPLILVHGIRSSPTSPSDPGSAFGEFKEKAFKYKEFPPVMVFDFPWNSNRGSILDYCGGLADIRTLYGFAYGKCGDWKLKPVFFVHSMGGLLLLEQLKEDGFRSFANALIFGGSPFCGSDLANFLNFKRAGKAMKLVGRALNKVRTTDKNLKLLARGSSEIWKRMKDLPGEIKSLFIVGDGKNAYPTGQGDGTVNLSSASLKNSVPWPEGEILNVGLEHGEIVEINFPPHPKHLNIINKIKTILEH